MPGFAVEGVWTKVLELNVAKGFVVEVVDGVGPNGVGIVVVKGF